VIDREQGASKGVDVVLDQSTISEGDDLRVLECARGLHVGKLRKLSAESLADQSNEFVWRLTLNLPIENDKFYSWLLSGPAPSM
jgi:hypothetical protein